MNSSSDFSVKKVSKVEENLGKNLNIMKKKLEYNCETSPGRKSWKKSIKSVKKSKKKSWKKVT